MTHYNTEKTVLFQLIRSKAESNPNLRNTGNTTPEKEKTSLPYLTAEKLSGYYILPFAIVFSNSAVHPTQNIHII